MQESFIFYDSFRDVGKDMEEKSRLAFYEAIIDYGLTGELDVTNLPNEIKLLFKLIKPQIDANVKRRKDGKKGGRPSKSSNNEEKSDKKTSTKEEKNYEKTTGLENKNHRFQNEKPNVNVNGNVNGNGNVNVYEYTEEQFGRTLAPAEIELIKSWDYSEEIIKLAVDETVLNQVNSIKYTDKILYEWDKQGLKTVNDIKSKLKQRREKEEDVDTPDVSYYRSLE
jgi:DnaD/phage-associated family protein